MFQKLNFCLGRIHPQRKKARTKEKSSGKAAKNPKTKGQEQSLLSCFFSIALKRRQPRKQLCQWGAVSPLAQLWALLCSLFKWDCTREPKAVLNWIIKVPLMLEYTAFQIHFCLQVLLGYMRIKGVELYLYLSVVLISLLYLGEESRVIQWLENH